MARRDDDLLEDHCPECGAHTGGDSVCPNCGAEIFDDSGLSEVDEESDDDSGNGEDDEPEQLHRGESQVSRVGWKRYDQ